MISSVGSGPDLNCTEWGQNWTPIEGQFWMPIDSSYRSRALGQPNERPNGVSIKGRERHLLSWIGQVCGWGSARLISGRLDGLAWTNQITSS